MGGASGVFVGTLFISMSKVVANKKLVNLQDFSDSFSQGVEAVKKKRQSRCRRKDNARCVNPGCGIYEASIRYAN